MPSSQPEAKPTSDVATTITSASRSARPIMVTFVGTTGCDSSASLSASSNLTNLAGAKMANQQRLRTLLKEAGVGFLSAKRALRCFARAAAPCRLPIVTPTDTPAEFGIRGFSLSALI
jgi:hypothetical protein